MTEIEIYKDTLSQPEVIREAWSLAAKIAGTEFVPKSLRGSTEKVMAALLAGRELGLGPMTALAHVHIVEGRPALSAESKQALAQSAGHTIDIIETNSERCVVFGQRAGSDRGINVEWSMKDARAAGLANKDNWKKHPRRMLQARATSEAVRLVAPDTTLGIPLSIEEASDGVTFGPAEIEPGPVEERTVRRNGKAKPEPTPPPAAEGDDIVDAEVVDEPAAADPPSDKQKGKFFALCGEKGLSDDDRHAIINEATGGRSASWNDVTKDEAGRLIDQVEDMDTPPDADTDGEPPWAGLDANGWLTYARSRSVKLVDFRPLGVTSYTHLAGGSDDLKAKAWSLPDQLEEPF